MLKGVFAKNKRGYSLILKSIESTQIKRVFNLTCALSTKLPLCTAVICSTLAEEIGGFGGECTVWVE